MSIFIKSRYPPTVEVDSLKCTEGFVDTVHISTLKCVHMCVRMHACVCVLSLCLLSRPGLLHQLTIPDYS